MQRRHFLGDLPILVTVSVATLAIPTAVAQNTKQELQAAQSPSALAAVQNPNQGLQVSRTPPTVAIWAAVIAGAIAIMGNVITAYFQRRAIDKQIAAQRENLEAQFKNNMEGQRQQYEQQRTISREEEAKKTQGLVIAAAIEVIAIVARTEVYGDQVATYTELTLGNTERLRIDISSSLILDSQHIYLFAAPKALAEIKILTTLVERANRRVDQLKSFLNQQPVISAEKFKPVLEDLAEIYKECAESGDRAIDVLKAGFPGLGAMIDEADKTIRLPWPDDQPPAGPAPAGSRKFGRLVSKRVTRYLQPFGPDVSP